jgi:hypothetical protein
MRPTEVGYAKSLSDVALQDLSLSTRGYRMIRLIAPLMILGLFFGLGSKTGFTQQFRTNRVVEGLLESTKRLRAMSDDEIRALVPIQSGLHYVDCPNCERGRQENQLQWSIDAPDRVCCQFCNHAFPSEKFPMTQQIVVKGPQGKTAVYPYWEDRAGYRHFFAAKRDDLVKGFLAQQALDFAILYQETRDLEAAHKAAIILDRFAEVFPNWCYRYDYPFRQKEIYDGPVSPRQFRDGFRTARWNWWAYSDIPVPLIQAFERTRESGAFEKLSGEKRLDVLDRIEVDLIRNACDQVLANRDDLTNMSPTAWRGLIAAGKTIHEPLYIHEPFSRFNRFVSEKFFYDGMWHEGAPDYGWQSLGGLEQVARSLEGYSDPIGYRNPTTGLRFDRLNVMKDSQSMKLAKRALNLLRLPNGRAVPIHDTWPTSQRGVPEYSDSYLLPGLGHGCIAGGRGDQQWQLHMTWSGGYGHSHGDNLSLLLYAHGRELLSDLGYTHTAYRPWTIATLAHNTVVIDGENQSLGGLEKPTDGNLEIFDVSNEYLQVMRATGDRGYGNQSKMYRRTNVVVRDPRCMRYLVDLFDVEGGRIHDYLLHGDADHDQSAITNLHLSPLATLVPGNQEWAPTRNEGETRKIMEPYYAYGFLKSLRSAPLLHNTIVNVRFESPDGQSPVLGVHIIPQKDSSLVIGKNPSIRNAREDDSQLDSVYRPFAMVRHQAHGGRSRFVTVVDPYVDQPEVIHVESIQATDDCTVLAIRTRSSDDLVVVNDSGENIRFEYGGDPFTFSGRIGAVSRSTVHGQIEWAYVLGDGTWTEKGYSITGNPTYQSKVRQFVTDGILLEPEHAARITKNTVLRLKTEDHWTYGFTVSQAMEQNWGLLIQPQESVPFHYDPGKKILKIDSFPQREHVGEVTAEWDRSSFQLNAAIRD